MLFAAHAVENAEQRLAAGIGRAGEGRQDGRIGGIHMQTLADEVVLVHGPALSDMAQTGIFDMVHLAPPPLRLPADAAELAA